MDHRNSESRIIHRAFRQVGVEGQKLMPLTRWAAVSFRGWHDVARVGVAAGPNPPGSSFRCGKHFGNVFFRTSKGTVSTTPEAQPLEHWRCCNARSIGSIIQQSDSSEQSHNAPNAGPDAIYRAHVRRTPPITSQIEYFSGNLPDKTAPSITDQ